MRPARAIPMLPTREFSTPALRVFAAACLALACAGAPAATPSLSTLASGRIVLDSVDPYQDADAGDLAYRERNRARGRSPGQVTIRLRYGELATPWYELLNLSAPELEALAAKAAWRLTEVVGGEPGEFYAVLEKGTARRDSSATGAAGRA